MVYMKRRKSMIRRFIALLCCVAVICSGSPIHTKASFEDCWNMKLNSLTFYIQDKEETCTKLGKYNKSLNESPYVMAIPQHVKYTSGKEYKNIGIKDDVLKRQTFSMIYVQTGYGFSVGARAFQFVTVYYKQDMVTDMDVDFYSGDESSVASKGVIEIGERAFQGLQVPYGYMNIDKMNGSIGAYAFADAYIKEGLTIQEGLIDEIGAYAFKGLKAPKLKLPGCRKIGDGAFQETRYATYGISDKTEELGSKIWEGCENLQTIILPDTPGTMKKVAADTFPDQAGITIKVPAGYKDLSVYHFENYSNLKYELAPEYTEDSEVYKQLKELGAEVTIADEVIETPSPSPEVTPSQSPAADLETPVPSKSPETGTATPVPTKSPAVDRETPSPSQSSAAPAPIQSPEIGINTPIPVQSPENGTDAPMVSAVPSAQKTGLPLAKGSRFTIKEMRYEVLGNRKAACLGGISSGKKIVSVPDTIRYGKMTYRVTGIAPKAFYKNKKLRQIKIGKYVRKIGKSSFEQCTSLKKVSFGRSVIEIEKKAFYGDRNIRSLDFKGGRLKKVEKKAFSRGRRSKKVFVPAGVKKQRYYKLLQGSIVD